MPVQTARAAVVSFAAFEVDLRTGELRKHGIRVKLQDQPFKILAMLLEHPGELVTREQIKQALWPADTYVDFEHSVNAAIRRLRDALGDDADSPRFIETLPRRGYRLLVEVATPAERTGTPDTDEASPAQPATIPPQFAAGWSWRAAHGWWPLAAAAAILLLGLLAWILWPRPAIESVAVLPFVNETGNPNVDYLADGIAETVLDNLSEVQTLRVMSRNSAFRFRKSPINTGQAAAQLQVRALVMGALRRNGDKLEASVELIEAQGDRHLWGNRYGVDPSQIGTVSADIVEQVARNLRQRITSEARRRMALRQPMNPVAYESYLRGRHLLETRMNINSQNALLNFQTAIDADPKFASAYAGMAAAYGLLAYNGGMEPTEALRRQEIAVDRAIELNPDLVLARVGKGYNLLNFHRDTGGAEREMQRAIALEPNSAEAHHAYAAVLSNMGRMDAAVAEAKRAVELDPLSGANLAAYATITYHMRQYDKAIQLRRQYSVLNPAPFWYAMVYAAAGRKNEALAELNQINPTTTNPRGRCIAAQAYAMAGEPERARAALASALAFQKVVGSPVTQYCSPYDIAAAYAALADRTEMFRWLRTADSRLDPRLPEGIRTNPPFDRYRSDPEFIDFVDGVFRPR